jgi:EmrB/QacA subfamily drug resistance transporter
MSDDLGQPRDKTTSLAPSAPPTRTGRHANTGLVVVFLSLAGLSFAILTSLVAPALPTIAEDLHTSTSSVSWVLTAYLLAAAVLTPILGRLGDMVGKRRVLLIVIAVLAAGTLLAALATSLSVLIVARLLQGAAGAILPLSIGIVRDELPHERVGLTVGILSAIFGVGGGLGIVLSGPIVAHLSWHWLFWIPLVLVLVALAGVAFGVPESQVRAPGRVDLIGAGILSGALASLLLAISKGQQWGWAGASTLGLLAAGVVLLVVFVLVELRVHEPLIDMRLMRIRGVWATDLLSLVFGFLMFGVFILIPLLLELPSATGYGFGKSVTQAGLFLLPTTVMMMIFGPMSGLLDRRFGPKLPLFLGAIAATAAFVVPAFAHDTTGALLVSCLLNGAGVGLGLAAMSNAIIESVPATHTGEATGVNSVVRTIGGSIGTAVVAAILASNSTAQGLPTDQAFTAGFWVCASVGIIGIAAVLAVPSARRRHADAVAAGVEDLGPAATAR